MIASFFCGPSPSVFDQRKVEDLICRDGIFHLHYLFSRLKHFRSRGAIEVAVVDSRLRVFLVQEVRDAKIFDGKFPLNIRNHYIRVVFVEPRASIPGLDETDQTASLLLDPALGGDHAFSQITDIISAAPKDLVPLVQSSTGKWRAQHSPTE